MPVTIRSAIITVQSGFVVNNTSFNLAVPAEFSQSVGVVTATNSPTSWSITGGNTGGVFFIDNSGNITANANLSLYSAYSTGVQPITYTLTVQATGIGGPVSGTVSIVCSQLPWPSLTNRPSVSGGTLSWTGPAAGGPSTVNDISQTHALTTNTGNFTTSSNGQLVQYKDITGDFILQHNNVTLSRCRIQGVIFPFSIPSGSTGFAIEDCDFGSIDGVATPLFAGNGSGAIINTIIRRCASHNVENNLTAYALGVVLKDSIFFNVSGADSDQWELYTTIAAGDNGVGSTNSVVICNNTYQGPLISGVYNSAVNLTNGNSGSGFSTGTIGPDIFVDHNFFNDCAPVTGHIINDDNAQGSGAVQWNAINNGFFRTVGQSYRIGRSTMVTNTGNFNMATAGDFTGALANGTGAI